MEARGNCCILFVYYGRNTEYFIVIVYFSVKAMPLCVWHFPSVSIRVAFLYKTDHPFYYNTSAVLKRKRHIY